MKMKRLIILIVSLIVAGVLGVLIYYATTTNVTVPEDKQQTATVTEPEVVAASTTPRFVSLTGDFVDADETHTGSGTVNTTYIDNKLGLGFQDNFTVGDGPDLYVYLSPNLPSGDLGDFYSLGALKSKTGAQSYDLPDNYQEYKTVVIWCKQFNVAFAKAELLEVN